MDDIANGTQFSKKKPKRMFACVGEKPIIEFGRAAMDDIANGTQFSDLPSYLAIDILVRLPVKALLICRYVRKDWNRLYFSDPYFIRRQLATSNIQFLNRDLKKGRKFQFGCFEDEVSTENLRMETLDFSCKLLHDPKYDWCVVNSCNGLVCLIDAPYGPHCMTASSSVYVCNPILGEWVFIPVPYRNNFYRSSCALGFSAKNNQYKVLLCFQIKEENDRIKYDWEIYTLGTGQWRSIEAKETTEPWSYRGMGFNTFIHGSIHWIGYIKRRRANVIQSFDFETERFTILSLPQTESDYLEPVDVKLGIINGCLWASFFNWENYGVEMWAMKEYGVQKSWTMILWFRDTHSYDPPDQKLLARNKELVIYKEYIRDSNLLFSLNGEEMLICNCSFGDVKCYNIKRIRRRIPLDQCVGRVIAYNPSFVSLHDVGKGEQVIKLSSY